jgi:D-glutamate N-acetyltransferase
VSSGRSWLVLADGYLTDRAAKTAHGVLRYSPDRIAAVLDRDHAGRSLSEVLPELACDAPIVASMSDALKHRPTSLLLGVATPGGWLPDSWRGWIEEAIQARLEIVNGLHRFLTDDKELVRLARRNKSALWDVRKPPTDIALFSGRSISIPKRTVLTVGSDCAVGKMTVSLELARAGHASGVSTEFIATGQTGIMISGRGIAVDRVISDFVAGAAERLVTETHPSSDVLLVEGQGSLWHPAYSGVTLGLLHGTAPHAMVLCHQAGRTAIEEPPYTKLPGLSEMVTAYESAAATVRPARVACIALNCQGMSGSDGRDFMAEIEDETGLPVGDVWAGDAEKLWAATVAALPARRKAVAAH